MYDALQDLRFTLRGVRALASSTAAALSIIALGTGVNTALFAVTYGILLRPLPYRERSRVVVVSMEVPDGTDIGLPIEEFKEWQQRLRTIQSAAAYCTTEFTMRGLGEPRLVRTALVTEAFFDVVGANAEQGQTLGLSGSSGWAVISHEVAAGSASSPSERPFGRGVTSGTSGYVVAAVMPLGFGVPSEDTGVWIPASSVGVSTPSERARQYRIIARLKPGVTVQQLADDATRVSREIGQRGRRPKIATLENVLVGSMRPVLRAALTASIMVLLVACGNVATLLLGRAVARRRDLAVKLALGASPRRLASGALAESFLIATAGSLLGLGIGVGCVRLFVQSAAGVLPRLHSVAIDVPVLAASIMVTVIITVLCGAAPVLFVLRGSFTLSSHGATTTAYSAAWTLRGGLVVAQIALSTVLLVGAGLLARTLVQLLRSDAGIEPTHVLTAKLALSDVPNFDVQEHAPFIHELIERVSALPAVHHVGVGSSRPPSVAPLWIGIRLRVGRSDDEFRMLNVVSVTPGYFSALGARLINGRFFEAADADSDDPIVLLSESAARFFSPECDLVGQRLPTRLPPVARLSGPPRVVGVVDDVKYNGLDSPARSAIYLPWMKLPAGVYYLVVRTAQDPMALAPTVERIIRELRPTIPISEVRSLEDKLAESVADRRLRLFPAVGFAVLSLAVALVGLNGTLARFVTERQRELATRAALGASFRQVTGRILVMGAALTTAGVVTGLVAAAAGARVLSGLLYDVSPYDPSTFIGVALLVSVASLVASYMPARRAARLDPRELLWTE